MPEYGTERWTGDPTLDGFVWAIGVPLNREMVLLEGRGRPPSLMADAMHRAAEQGIEMWRVAEQPRGSHLLVKSPQIVQGFLDAIGWTTPRDHRFDFVEVMVKDSGREPPRNAPEEFFRGFFAGRLRPAKRGVMIDWPASEERIEECLSHQGVKFQVPEEGTYHVTDPEQLPGFALYERHRDTPVHPTEFALLDVWPPLSGSQRATEKGEKRVVDRLREVE